MRESRPASGTHTEGLPEALAAPPPSRVAPLEPVDAHAEAARHQPTTTTAHSRAFDVGSRG